MIHLFHPVPPSKEAKVEQPTPRRLSGNYPMIHLIHLCSCNSRREGAHEVEGALGGKFGTTRVDQVEQTASHPKALRKTPFHAPRPGWIIEVDHG